jgi:hypothetical protein
MEVVLLRELAAYLLCGASNAVSIPDLKDQSISKSLKSTPPFSTAVTALSVYHLPAS